jgi:hypothetical protein
MKASYLLIPLTAVALAGCTVYRPVAVATPTPVIVSSTPTFVSPPNTVILGAGPADWNFQDADGDGISNSADRYPYDSRFR